MQRWFPEKLEHFRIVTVLDVLREALESGRLRVDPSRHPQLTTYHDPCNYGRKGLRAFGQAYFEEGRWIMRQCAPHCVEMSSDRERSYCCGAGGGSWAMPYREERVFHGRFKAQQIKATGARLVVTPCHNCRDQLRNSLCKEFDLDVEVKDLCELVAEALLWPA